MGASETVGGQSRWPASDLCQRLLRSLEIARRAVELLGAGGADATETNGRLPPDKVVAESSLLLLAAASVETDGPGSLASATDALAQALVPVARSERVAVSICLRPAALSELSFAHSCLRRLGYPDPGFDRLVDAARTSDVASARERLPHRAMEQEWIARVANGSGDRTALLPRMSVLGLGIDALTASRDDFYAFTHAVMYITDFGAYRPRLPRPWQAVEAEAEVGLAYSLDAGDYDVAGEMLLTWPLLHRPWSSAATFGFQLLTAVEDEAGFLPPPGISLEPYLRLEGADRTHAVFADVYHTAYVMGLLSAAALRPGAAPPARMGGRPRFPGASAPILALLDQFNPSGARPYWRERANELTRAQRDTLSPLFLAILLRRAATIPDLELVRHALRVGNEHGLVDGPTPRHALQLLHRASRLPTRLPG